MPRYRKQALLLALLLLPATAALGWKQTDIDEARPAQSAYIAGDYAKAAIIFSELASRGNAVAQFNLGIMYAEGQYVGKSSMESIKWYQLAAAQGYPDAQYKLGIFYREASSLVQDYPEALHQFRMAADQGNTLAMLQIASMHMQGQGTMQNEAEAVRWYRKAAEQGDTSAQRSLSTAYALGRGIAQNPVLSYMWLILAISYAKNEEKQHDLTSQMELAAKSLSIDQIAEARKLAEKCASNHFKGC